MTLVQGRATRRISDVYDYNLQITSLRQKKLWRDAIEVLSDMRAAAILPDVVSCNSATSTMARQKLWPETLAMVVCLRSREANNNFPNLITMNTFISACEGSKRWSLALTTFQLLLQKRFTPDNVSFSSSLHVLRGAWERTSNLWQCMPSMEIRPNLVVYNTFLGSLEAAEKSWCLALSRWHEIPWRSLSPDIVSCGSLLSACAKSGAWRRVMKLIEVGKELLSLNILTFNAAFNGITQQKHWDIALELFGEILRGFHGSVQVDLITLNSIMSSATPWPCALRAIGLSRTLSLRLDQVSWHGILSCERRPWRMASEICSKMTSQMLHGTVVTFSGLLIAWSQAGHWMFALGCLRAMNLRQVRSNIISHNNALYACRRRDQWTVALKIMKQLMSWTLPNVISYSTTLSNLAVAPNGVTDDESGVSTVVAKTHWQRGIALCAGCKQERLHANEVLQNALGPNSLGPWRFTLHHLWHMKQVEALPNLVSFNGALHRCLQWDVCLELLATAEANNAWPDVISYTMAAQTCARQAQSLAVAQLLKCDFSACTFGFTMLVLHRLLSQAKLQQFCLIFDCPKPTKTMAAKLSGMPAFVNDKNNPVGYCVQGAIEFGMDSRRLIQRCTKPDAKEFKKIAVACAIGFSIMGFIGYTVKLVFIPINNIIVGGS
eukprot:symbB.v1.2.012993.t1/scaffold905.1/size153338/1